ncbi:MAG: maleylpyruvate isomerase family mycothiol-dependent enzyme [Marmoricola sp.]
MTSLASRTIDALRHEHDVLSDFVASLTPEQLEGPSGASEWSVAQVLSHLGSGSEISLASLQTALGEREAPGDDFNRSVWDVWDAKSPADQGADYVTQNKVLVEALEALTPDQLESLKVDLGFLPAPIGIAGYAGMRLNEVAHHSWDVRVATDPKAGITDPSTDVLADHLGGDLGFLLGFIGKPDQIEENVVLGLGDYSLVIADSVSVQSGTDGATATFSGAPEAALRLTSGRLRPEYTPADVAVTGNVTLDELRRVFPGF